MDHLPTPPQNPLKKLPEKPQNSFLYLLITALVLTSLYFFYNPNTETVSKIALSQFVEDVETGKVKRIEVEGARVHFSFKDEGDYEFFTIKEPGATVKELLEGVDIAITEKIEIEVSDSQSSNFWRDVAVSMIPFGLLILFFLFMMRQAQGVNNQAMSFGKSSARVSEDNKKKTKFKEVAGADEAKAELEEIVEFLKHPKKFTNMGAKIPKGVLLFGPTGCGKTLLARAVACEANVPFFNISGSEFVEMFVGVGASRVRDLFKRAKKNAPCIVFIDEIDAVGRQRGAGMGGGHDEREQTLNQILTEMDGFEQGTNVIVVAASVTGDTQTLIRRNGKYELKPIEEIIDAYYKEGEEGVEKETPEIEVLGMEQKWPEDGKTTPKLLFKGSAWKKVRSVFRHRVDEIYEIKWKGNTLRTTGNHSVFVRSREGLKAKRVDELKIGEYLVDIPYIANRTQSKNREIRAHLFSETYQKTLPVYPEKTDWQSLLKWKYDVSLAAKPYLSQAQIGEMLGIAQTTVSKWQTTSRMPRELTRAYYKYELPKTIDVSPELCRLIGYYVAEGYARKEIDFCFNKKETEYIEDVKNLMKKLFGLYPDREIIKGNAINIVYNAKPLADFFKEHGGKGAHHKHVPNFLFETPKNYFIEFLRGYFNGDGHEDKKGRMEMTSVSKQLILELNWLSRMHGYKSYVHSFKAKAGRTINGGKPLKETVAWRLGYGKTQNPLHPVKGKASIKRAKILSIAKKPFQGYVYDFCGCENEAFFGGASPILLHNTNRPDVLDPALLRPGRFDRRVVVDRPDIKAREAILQVHARNKPLASNVDLKSIARQTPGFSGADLENLMNEAAILAAKEEKKKIDMMDIEHSIEKVALGPERKSRVMSPAEKKITAYHEVGHALSGHFSLLCDPVHKVSIVSRGMALGVTWFVPEEDKTMNSKSKFMDEITAALGGYVAEELIFGEMTTGASSDLQKATRLARQMVTEYGMSPLGPIIYGEANHEVFLGRDYGHVRNYSEKMAAEIDAEVEKFVKEGYKRSRGILEKHKDLLHKITTSLLEKETLGQKEFLEFLPRSTWKEAEIKAAREEEEKEKTKKKVREKHAHD